MHKMKIGMKGEHLIVSKCLDAVKGSSCLKFYCDRTGVWVTFLESGPDPSKVQAGKI